jgi:anoctamin-10
MALVNNILELRSDAFKITVHNRRPTPARTDTIGPWLDAMIFLTWLSALTNSALVYLFRSSHRPDGWGQLFSSGQESKNLLISATLIALASSHGYLLLRVAVRHLVERVAWKGNLEVELSKKAEMHFKEMHMKSVESQKGSELQKEVKVNEDDVVDASTRTFWQFDEGLEEIRRAVKEA